MRSVAGQAVAPKSSACLFRDTARQCSTTSTRRSPDVSVTTAKPRQWLPSVCVKRKCCRGLRNEPLAKRRVWPLGAHEVTGTPSPMRSCRSTRGSRLHARLALLGCGPCCTELECGWQGTSSGQAARRQQGRPREAHGSLQVSRERIREHLIKRLLLTHAAAGSTPAVAVSCGFWKVVKQWRPQNHGGRRSEGRGTYTHLPNEFCMSRSRQRCVCPECVHD